jgi:hypothetical protein
LLFTVFISSYRQQEVCQCSLKTGTISLFNIIKGVFYEDSSENASKSVTTGRNHLCKSSYWENRSLTFPFLVGDSFVWILVWLLLKTTFFTLTPIPDFAFLFKRKLWNVNREREKWQHRMTFPKMRSSYYTRGKRKNCAGFHSRLSLRNIILKMLNKIQFSQDNSEPKLSWCCVFDSLKEDIVYTKCSISQDYLSTELWCVCVSDA